MCADSSLTVEALKALALKLFKHNQHLLDHFMLLVPGVEPPDTMLPSPEQMDFPDSDSDNSCVVYHALFQFLEPLCLQWISPAPSLCPAPSLSSVSRPRRVSGPATTRWQHLQMHSLIGRDGSSVLLPQNAETHATVLPWIF